MHLLPTKKEIVNWRRRLIRSQQLFVSANRNRLFLYGEALAGIQTKLKKGHDFHRKIALSPKKMERFRGKREKNFHG